jgi:hypothetical protein
LLVICRKAFFAPKAVAPNNQSSNEENSVTHKYNAREKRKRRKAKLQRQKEEDRAQIAKAKESKK